MKGKAANFAEDILVAAAKATSSPSLKLELAKHYLKINEWGKAIKLLYPLLQIEDAPEAGEIYFTIASAYKKIGFKSGEREYFDKSASKNCSFGKIANTASRL